MERVSIIASFHYLELKARGLLKTYFDNIRKIRQAGASYYINMVLCDEYMPYLEEIREVCMKELGVLPHLNYVRRLDLSIQSELSEEEYIKIGMEFGSDTFDFDTQIYKKKITEFCYAGDWFFRLDLCTGEISKCYGEAPFYNVYKKIEEKIPFEAIGCHCHMPYCYNGLSRMSLGVIPTFSAPEYWRLRNRTDLNGRDCYSERMKEFCSGKLIEENEEYDEKKKRRIAYKYKCQRITKNLHKMTPIHLWKFLCYHLKKE